MEKLFERHDNYLADVPMGYVREIAGKIDWGSRLIAIKGPKGVGKSTMMLQHIKKNFAADDMDSAVGRKIPLWAFGFLY